MEDEVILLGLAHAGEARRAALRSALAAALARGDPATAALCLRCAGDAAERRLLACAFADGLAQPMVHAAIAPAGAPDTAEAALLVPLLRAGASSAAVDGQTRSACHVAAARGRSAALELLLAEHGAAAATLRSRDGQTAIAAALCARPHGSTHCECVRLLLREGCPADGACTRARAGGLSQLHAAVLARCAACTGALLARSADPCARLKGADRSTPLHAAAAIDSHGRVTELLLRAAADPLALDARREAPVHVAAAAWNGCALARLLDAAAEPAAAARKRDAQMATPLHHLALGSAGARRGARPAREGAAADAGEDGEPEGVPRVGALVRLLLRKRADPDAIALDGRTALAQAVARLASPPAALDPADMAELLALCAALISGHATVDSRALALLRGGPAAAGASAAGPPGAAAAARQPRARGAGGEGPAAVPRLSVLCQLELRRLIDADSVSELHALALQLDAPALRAACEDYALQLGFRGERAFSAILAVLRQMTSAWAPAAWGARGWQPQQGSEAERAGGPWRRSESESDARLGSRPDSPL